MPSVPREVAMWRTAGELTYSITYSTGEPEIACYTKSWMFVAAIQATHGFCLHETWVMQIHDTFDNSVLTLGFSTYECSEYR